jgi:hypothetical protein
MDISVDTYLLQYPQATCGDHPAAGYTFFGHSTMGWDTEPAVRIGPFIDHNPWEAFLGPPQGPPYNLPEAYTGHPRDARIEQAAEPQVEDPPPRPGVDLRTHFVALERQRKREKKPYQKQKGKRK